MSIAIARTIKSQNGTQTGCSPHDFHLEATGTTSTTYTTATSVFRNLLFKTDWGDTYASGTAAWAYGADATRLKNISWGCVASHVYEITEGGGDKTFTPTTYVTDGVDVASSSSITLTVQDPATFYAGTNTVAVANGAAPVAGVDGVPAGAQCVGGVTTWGGGGVTDVLTYVANGKRVLMKHDDTFSMNGNRNISINGRWELGMYGTGAKPQLIPNAAGRIAICQGTAATGPFTDYCFRDIEMVGGQINCIFMNYNTGTGASNNVRNAQLYDGVLMLRIKTTDVFRAVFPMVQFYIHMVDCDFSTPVGEGGNVVFGIFPYGSTMGCAITQKEATNLVGNGVYRNGDPTQTVVSNNTFSGAESFRQHIKYFNACDPLYGASYQNISNSFIISCNKFVGYGSTFDGTHGDVWWVEISPQNAGVTERLETWVVEDNWWVMSPIGDIAIYTSVGKGTIRNNLADFSAVTGGTGTAFDVFWPQGQTVTQPDIDDVDIVNNTAYLSQTAAGTFNMVQVDSRYSPESTNHPSTNVRVKNNLLFAGGITTRNMLRDINGHVAAGDQANNTQVSSPSATWVSSNGVGTGTFSNPSDFKLRSGAPERNVGTAVQVKKDAFNVYRPQGTIDTGFAEYDQGTVFPWLAGTSPIGWLHN